MLHLEYEMNGSGRFQSGERQRDLEWIHSHVPGKLIIKGVAGAHGQAATIVAILAAKNLGEADKIAHKLVMM